MKNPNLSTLLLVSASLALAAPLAFAQSAPPTTTTTDDATATRQMDAAHDQAKSSVDATAQTPPTSEAQAASTAQQPAPQTGERNWADLDGDGNGNLSASEAAAMPTLAKVFSEADADKNGELTPDEYRAWFAANQSKTPTAEGGTPDGTKKRGG